MGKSGKQHRKISEQVDMSKPLDLKSAVEFLQTNSYAKFDETAELAFRLGVDPSKSDQGVRGSVALPHGTGKDVRIVVFASGEAADAAREAGATEVGFMELVEKVKEGWTDFDVAIATAEAMQEVRKLGKVLGPRGLMPNPRTGTVTEDTGSAVKQFKAGRVEFRMDRNANLAIPFGKLSFSVDQLLENARAAIAAVVAARPGSAKGVYIKRFAMSSTMGVGLSIDGKELPS
ncbi:MAG: 50S ribosomal protein L1 [Verrucomicrobiota bacterium]